MGATYGKSSESEACRIIVEDVTSSMTSQQEVTLPEVFSPVSEERRRSSASSETTTTVCGGSRRGSVDTRRSSGGGGVTEFWVPASVVQRTRSRSLVPPDQISSDDNDNAVRGIHYSTRFAAAAAAAADDDDDDDLCY